MRQLPNSHIFLIFILTTTLGLTAYLLELVPWLFTSAPAPQYLSATSTAEQLCAPAARYLSPRVLIDSLSPSPSSEERTTNDGFPKLIHQSWMDDNLPVRFSRWSDSLRLRHPDWRWVLWTDEDNAALISTRHPQLNESYWALRNNIQRADFVRNLYMWNFGGVYADLDMECLRPLTSILTNPDLSLLSPSYPISLPSSSSASSSPAEAPVLAYAGSMDTLPHESHHSIPNAFLASSRPHHPFWLLPLSRVLTHLHAGADGTGVQSDMSSEAEAVTGPEALLRSVETYRGPGGGGGLRIGSEGVASSSAEEQLAEHVHASLRDMLAASAKKHEVAVFDTGVIYPFSWSVTEKTGKVHQACRAAPGFPFDPIKCQDACKAYERGARMITYWSHTWKQGDNSKDLGVVAVGS